MQGVGSCSAAAERSVFFAGQRQRRALAAAAQRWSAVVSLQVSGALLQRSSAAQGFGSGSVAAAAQRWSAVLSSQGSGSTARQRTSQDAKVDP